MISVDGLAVEFGGTTLFSDISFVINEKDRIALMGKNGAGKSTLLKILAGVRQPTRGKVSAPKDCVVAYLPQHLMTEDGRTVFDETAQAFAHLHEMEAQIDRLNKELETRTDYESDSYMALIEEVSALSEKFYSIDATNYEEDVEKSLLGLGFTREDFQRQTSDFSGGWRMRIELAKLLLQKPDVLLLDEPTNHLDIPAREAVEEALMAFPGTFLAVSHDRYFLDKVANCTLELENGKLTEYLGNYSYYLMKKEIAEEEAREEREALEAAEREQQAKAKHEAEARRKAAAQEEKTDDEVKKAAERRAEEKKRAELGRIQSMSDAKREEMVQRAEAEIAMAEAELKGLEFQMNNPTVQADPQQSQAIAEAYAAKEKEIEMRYEKWERLTEA